MDVESWCGGSGKKGMAEVEELVERGRMLRSQATQRAFARMGIRIGKLLRGALRLQR